MFLKESSCCQQQFLQKKTVFFPTSSSGCVLLGVHHCMHRTKDNQAFAARNPDCRRHCLRKLGKLHQATSFLQSVPERRKLCCCILQVVDGLHGNSKQVVASKKMLTWCLFFLWNEMGGRECWTSTAQNMYDEVAVNKQSLSILKMMIWLVFLNSRWWSSFFFFLIASGASVFMGQKFCLLLVLGYSIIAVMRRSVEHYVGGLNPASSIFFFSFRSTIVWSYFSIILHEDIIPLKWVCFLKILAFQQAFIWRVCNQRFRARNN